MEEVFKPIPGYEGIYEVSDYGNVRRVKSGRVLKPRGHNKGYWKVDLCKNGASSQRYIHRLVLLAFCGPASDDKPYARHLDGDPSNNRLTNLAYGCQRDNEEDKRLHGTWHLRGNCYALC